MGSYGVVVNQAVLRMMAEERIIDAGVLLAAGRWAYAYYVAGYAVECGLKSCVLAQMVHTGGVFTSKKFAEECFTHDFDRLVRLAGLTTVLAAETAANLAFEGYWDTATRWNESSRYEQKSQIEADRLYRAIADGANGVMRWIRTYW